MTESLPDILNGDTSLVFVEGASEEHKIGVHWKSCNKIETVRS